MKKFIIVFFALLFMIIYCSTVFACTPNVENLDDYNFDLNNDTDLTFSTFKSVMTFLVYFLLFVIISFLAFLTTKWLSSFQIKSHFKSKYMQVIDRLPLGNNKELYIVKTPQGMFIIGTCEKGMQILQKLDDKEAELITYAEENFNMPEKNFSNQLEYYLKKIRKPKAPEDSGGKDE